MPCPQCIINIPLNYYSGKDEAACIQRSVISLGDQQGSNMNHNKKHLDCHTMSVKLKDCP